MSPKPPVKFDKKVIVIVQARMNSSRLPKKVLADLNGEPLIGYMLNRLVASKHANEIWVACTDTNADDPLARYLAIKGFNCYRGSEDDVLQRYFDLATQQKADVIVRVTGDCPFADPFLIDSGIEEFLDGEFDYLSNTLNRVFPDGLDFEVFSIEALTEACVNANAPFHREHVTPYIHGLRSEDIPVGDFKKKSFEIDEDWSHIRLTVDYEEDLSVAQKLASLVHPSSGWRKIVSALTKDLDLMRENAAFIEVGDNKRYRADMKLLKPSFGISTEALERVSKIIPGASQTFSKSAAQWVVGASPLFLERGIGAEVYDIDGNRHIDYVLGLLPIILGYSDPDVNEAIRKQLQNGISFSLPTLLEEELAEIIIREIPCAEMTRFAKTGSDVTAAAIRLARAFTSRDEIVSIGYHGWHDWYIGTTTRNLGVPRSVQKLSHSFSINDEQKISDFFKVNGDKIAAIILEPDGATPTSRDFLTTVRKIADSYGALLIFDEVVTGFRMSTGGAQKVHGVIPDLACFGKAMGNGMPISAIAGRKDIMILMQEVFVSGTFGGEALSLAAAIATTKKLISKNIPAKLWAHGDKLVELSNAIFSRAGIDHCFKFGGNGWFPRLSVASDVVNKNLLNSLFRQEAVKHNLLMASSFNLCLAHTDNQILKATEHRLGLMAERLAFYLDSNDPGKYLEGRMIQPTFSVR